VHLLNGLEQDTFIDQPRIVGIDAELEGAKRAEAASGSHGVRSSPMVLSGPE
jgi:hypothetical protein